MNFIDSSIFVSLFDETDPARQGRARAIVRSALQESWTVSYQVVQETLDVLTRKIPTPLTSDQARRFLDAVLLPLWSVAPSEELYRRALDIQSRYQYGFHDAIDHRRGAGSRLRRAAQRRPEPRTDHRRSDDRESLSGTV